MIARPDPEQLLAGPLGGWLEQQALVREEAKNKAGNRLYLAALIGLPLLVFLWMLAPIGGQMKVLVTAFAGMGAFAWSQIPKSKAKKQVKLGINKAIAEALGLDYRPELEPGLPFSYCKRYGLVPSFDRSSFEDEWSGLLGGHRFTLFEAHLEEKRGSRKSRKWTTVFRGAILSIAFGREFHGTTLVQRAGQHRKLLGGKKDAIKLSGHRLECIDLVHPKFEDAFDVWSDDRVEAHYLVHPAYVERLIALEQGFHGQDIRALFTGGTLTIALKSDNLFESGSIDASQDRAKLAQTIEQFGRLADLAAGLNQQARGAPPAAARSQPAASAAESEAPAPVQAPAHPAAVPARPVFGRKGLS